MDDLNSLIAAEYNPRSISEQTKKDLYEAIGKFGDMSGLVYNKRTGRIVGGHQRRDAYQKHGGHITITEQLDAPNEVGTIARGYVVIGTEKFVYRVVDWPAQKERIANIATNKIGGDWDDEKLATIIGELRDAPDIADTGFSLNEITELLATVSDTSEDDADLTPPAEGKAKARLGDIYQLGDHRLMCGDITVKASLDALMDNGRADMVFTDPPYNVDYTGGIKGQKNRRRILNDKMIGEKFFEFLSSVCKSLLSVTDGAFYICISNSELHTLFRAFTKNGGHWQTYVIWAKHAFTLGRADYQHQFEPILYGLTEEQAKAADEAPDGQYEGLPILYGWSKHQWYGGRKQGDVWLIERPLKSPNHPTEKPVSLCARAIRNSSQRGQVILDGFGGSGSTLIACEQLQRRCRMMELDPRYVDVIIRRWQHFTGKKAVFVKNVSEDLTNGES